MIKEAIGFGNTIDEAKENALQSLGASELDDVQFDIMAMPKKKVLGMFGGAKAQVKAFIELPDKKVEKKPLKKQANKKPQPQKAQNNEKAEPKADKKAEAKAEKCRQYSDFGEPVAEAEIPENSPAKKAVEYIKTALVALNCKNITIKVASRENASLIIIDGDDVSILIGRRGETLDALQYLASLAANNGGGHYKISLNVGSYREKREETLASLAERIAQQVLTTGKARTLEPMNPYERRIIHTAIQNIEGVVSVSFGEGSNRRVVVSKEGVEVKPPRMNDNRQRNRRNGGQRNRQKPSNAVASAPAREPKRDSDIPLYGKIN